MGGRLRIEHVLSFSILLSSTSARGQGAAQPMPPGPTAYPYYQQPPPGAYPGPYAGPYAPSPRLPYREGVAPPAGYHLEEHARKGLVIAGAVVLGTTYFLSAASGMASENRADRWLLVPVFGPFMDLGARGRATCSRSEVDCFVEPFARIFLIMDGVAQTTGAILLVSGLVFRQKEFVIDSQYGLNGGAPRISWWTVTPDVMPGSRYGLVLRGALF